MQGHIKGFFDDLDAGNVSGTHWDLEGASEDMAALIIMNIMGEHGINAMLVVQAMRGGELEVRDGDVQLLASFRDKSRREEFVKAVENAAPFLPSWWGELEK